jgi:hypothetical protein
MGGHSSTNMKKAFHLILFCLYHYITFGQLPTVSFENLQSHNLKGKVKLVKTCSFNANKLNDAIVKTTKGWQYTWEHDMELFFNTEGNLELKKALKNGTTSVSYAIKVDDKNRIVQINENDLTYNIKYDSLNRILAAKEINHYRQIETDFVFQYNTKNNLVNKEEYLSKQLISTETYTYDSLNNLIKIHYEKGPYIEIESFEYDNENQLVKYEWYDNEEGIAEITTYQYVNKQKTFEHWLDYEDGEPDGYIDYTYENGNIIETKEIDRNGEILVHEFNAYEYDSQGNWVKMIIDDDGNYFIVERTISYY